LVKAKIAQKELSFLPKIYVISLKVSRLEFWDNLNGEVLALV